MRRWILICLILFAAVEANANPIVVNPVSLSMFWMVAFFALSVEAGVVTAVLSRRGLNLFRFFVVFSVANAACFTFIFLPLVKFLNASPIWCELEIVLLDCCAIKVLADREELQQKNFNGLSWWWALVASVLGNAASLGIGWLASNFE